MADENKDPNAEGQDGQSKDAAAGATGKGDDKSLVEFNTEQQKHIEKIVNEVFARGFERATKKSEDTWKSEVQKRDDSIATLQKQIEELKAGGGKKSDDKNDEGDGGKKTTKSAEIEKLQAQLDEMKGNYSTLLKERDDFKSKLGEADTRSRSTKIKESYITAVKDIEFFDQMEVFSLVENQLRVDDESGDVVVWNHKTDAPVLDVSMKPMSLAAYMAKFANEKPYLVKAKNDGGGSGSGSSRKMPDDKASDEVDFSKMTPEQFEAFKNKLKARA